MNGKDVTLKHNNYYTVADASTARRTFCAFSVILKRNIPLIYLLITSTLLNDWSLHWGYSILCAVHMSQKLISLHTITIRLRILSSSFIKESNLPSLSEVAVFHHSNVIFMLIMTEEQADET